jgi:phosphoglycolate phosphatase-like HAD superfamily hydrolase
MSPDYVRENWHWRVEPLGSGPAVIFDIDGVLADAAGRQHYLDWGDWKSFFDACGDDPIIEEIERLRWDLLIMREYGDYSGVDEFKRGALRDLVDQGLDIRLALDDDPKNHAMYVSEGVPCIYIHSGYYL